MHLVVVGLTGLTENEFGEVGLPVFHELLNLDIFDEIDILPFKGDSFYFEKHQLLPLWFQITIVIVLYVFVERAGRTKQVIRHFLKTVAILTDGGWSDKPVNLFDVVC